MQILLDLLEAGAALNEGMKRMLHSYKFGVFVDAEKSTRGQFFQDGVDATEK